MLEGFQILLGLSCCWSDIIHVRILWCGVILGYRNIELHTDLFSGYRAQAVNREAILGQVEKWGLRKPKRPRLSGMESRGTEAVEHLGGFCRENSSLHTTK